MLRAPEGLRVGFIGFGEIGQGVVQYLRRDAPEVEIVGAVVRDVARARRAGGVPLTTDIAELLARRPDVVAEVAGHDGLRLHGPAVLRSGADLLIVAVGAFADPGIERTLIDAAREGGGQLRVASGAIGALDAISAAAIGGLTCVTHTTRKPPAALFPPAEAAALTEPREVYRGTAREAALRYPENINVAAAVSLAGIGLDRTEVSIVADPALDRNRHVVEAEGYFGSIRFEIANIPSDNPKTARLTAMSVAAVLMGRTRSFVIG